MNVSPDDESRPGFHAVFGGLLLAEETISSLLDLIVALAVSTVDGVDGASISLLAGREGRMETSNATSAAVKAVDEGQYRDGDGPCVEAIRTGQEVTVTVPDDRWPTFSQRARQAGMGAVWSLPLHVRDRTTGALNLYCSGGPINGPAVETARALAGQAAVVLANAAALTSAVLTNQHLEEALTSRDLIGQAKGILMARQNITADAAFDLLVRASQRTGRKLRDVAADIARGPGHPPRD